MPLKINIAMSRKKGEPNFGSRGATVGLELEEDASLVNQPQQLHERLAKLFELAKEAVDRQLEGPLSWCRQRTDGDAITRNFIVRLDARTADELAAEIKNAPSATTRGKDAGSSLLDVIRVILPSDN
jgi:hypothetical protein